MEIMVGLVTGVVVVIVIVLIIIQFIILYWLYGYLGVCIEDMIRNRWGKPVTPRSK